ncbi:MAG: 4Fe-4S dicluster domain-containing protein [Gammaproteobacteria bacterium]
MSKVDANRRAFLRGAYLTRQGRAEQARQHNPLGPAPPWHQGRSLQQHCIDCAQPCVSACEQAIILIHPPQHSLSGTPYLNFASAGCTFCRACVETCPLDIAIDDKPAPRIIGKLVLNRDTCIAWDDIICMSCCNRCDYKAISLAHYRRPQIDAEICTGCGMCVSACPVQALSFT